MQIQNQKQILFRYFWLCMALVFLSSLGLFAQNLYVGGANTSDNNPGTATEPFATIQKAATVATAGDIINIRSGIYRETIIPINSGTPGNPIVFQPDGDAVVTISGADIADGSWVQHDGNIYKKAISMTNGYNANMTNNTTLMANQVFVNGEMMIEARWPNLSGGEDDLFDRTKFRDAKIGTWSTSGSQTLTDSAIPNIPGGWTGGTIWINGVWLSWTRDITNHSDSTLRLSGNIVQMKDWYYLTGRLGALDTEREFFYDGSYLYLWQPGGGSPVNVEVKKRNFAFDLRGKSNITIKNIKIFAASIMTNTYSPNITLDGINAKYINHAVTLTDSDVIYSHTGQSDKSGQRNSEQSTGIRLMGANSIIKNSHVYFASCMGIVLGENCTAYNNFVHDINYEGNYGSAIAPYNGASGQKILNNTMYRLGRACIDMQNSQNVEIGYNDMYDFGKLNNDVGAIYSARDADLTGTRIHHNWLHDAGNDIDHGWPVGAGIYLDQNSGPITIDHNVFWNNRMDDLRMEQKKAPYNMIYNNTMASTAETLDTPGNAWASASFDTYPENASTHSFSQNNIYRYNMLHHIPQDSELTRETDPLFVDPYAGGLGFLLQSGSPAIDHGIVTEGITGDYQGNAPDAGAYEYGGEEWVPGAVGYDIQLEFFNSSSDEPVEGMEVIFRGKQYTTNNQGIIQLSNIPDADYKIALSDTTFQLLGSDILEVFSDSVIRVYVRELPRYSVQMTFLDSISGNTVEGLKLSLAGSTHVSESQEMILIPELLEGNHSLAFPDNRFRITGDPVIEVRSDTTISVLVTKVPWLALQVINCSSGASVYRAAVTVNDEQYYT